MTTVGLDLLFVEPGATGGMETYARSLVPLLPDAAPDLRFTALVGRELAAEWASAPWHPAIEAVGLPVSSASRVARTGVELTLAERAIRRHGIGLVHGLGNVVPVGPGARRVVTVHDCIHFTHPETTSTRLAAGMRFLIRLGVKRADRIIAVSQSTARDLRALLGVNPALLEVIHSGPGTAPSSSAIGDVDVRVRLGIPEGPIVLAVAARRPHKNLERLIAAIAEVQGAVLVLPGYPTDFDEALRGEARRVGVAERVVLCGWVDEALLEGLYASAACLVVPSLVEGFGLPLLEGMARGVPVVGSEIPVLREIGGNAFLAVDPTSISAIAAGLRRVISDDAERQRLRVLGLERVCDFSWEASAVETAAVYRKVLRTA